MKSCCFGIIGAGGIASHFCNAVKLVENVEVVAVASKSEDRARKFAANNGIARYYGSYEEMLRCDDVDVVYVATTHNFHKENMLLCFEHGKHVLCEKPMVLTAADAREVFAAAKEKGLFCMEAMWARFVPQYQKAKEWITSGRIGEIQSINIVNGFHGNHDPESRLLNPALAGGVMYDIGVYAIEIATFLAGEKVENCMGTWRPNAVTGVDERLSVILQFPSCDAVFQSQLSGNAKEYVTVNGSLGHIHIPFVIGGHTISLYGPYRNFVEEFTEPFENGFVYEIQEVARCIREGKLQSNIMPPEATIECAEIFDRILRG